MSVNTNGSALRYEAALKDKDIITQIIKRTEILILHTIQILFGMMRRRILNQFIIGQHFQHIQVKV